MIRGKSWEQYSVELAKAKINFYEPFERLTLRKIVQDILSLSGAHRIDLFAIFDAVAKRGGFYQVQEKKRWIEIEYSLPYYKCNFKQIYQEHIAKRQDEIKKYLKRFDKEYTTNQEIFIEVYFLTNSSAGGFYHFQDDENSFCKQNFTYVDQYLNIKSISTVPCPINKIPAQFSEKYLLTRKWLIMKGYSRPFSEQELDRMQIMKIYNNNASVALIGWNLPNVLLALKLHELKFNVIIYTNQDRQYDQRSLERMLSVKEGVFILDNGIGGPFSYSQLFSHHGIQLSEVSNYCTLIDENGRMIPEYRVRETEELFLSLLADFKFEDSNKKLLQNQIHTLLAKKRLNDDYNLMKWHLQRYLMLNNFYGQETTVSLHSSFLNRRKHKIFMEKKRPVYIKNCSFFVQKALKSLKVIQLKPRHIDFCNNIWIVEQRPNQKRSFSALVYSDSQQVNDMINKRNYKIPSMQNENFTIFRQLSSNTWIHCCFRFKEKLKLKAEIVAQLSKKKKDFLKFSHYNLSEQNCSFQFGSNYGFFYYYIIEGGLGLITSYKIQKSVLNQSSPEQLKNSLPSQILKQFEINILSYKLPELSQPQVIEFSHSFYLKDESLNRDRIVKLKNWQRMYLLIGYPWSLNPNKLTSQIDCSNQILALIANVYYPLYKFDSTAKECFNNWYRKRKEEIMSQKFQNIQMKKISSQMSQHQIVSQISMKIVSQQNLPSKPIQLQRPQQSMAIEEQKLQQNENQLFQQNQKIKINVQFKHNMLPSKQSIFGVIKQSQDQQINSEFFGFDNSFVKSSYEFICQKVSTIFKEIQQKLNSVNDDESLLNKSGFFRQKISEIYQVLSEFQRSFSLQQPLKLSNNHFLHSLGKVRLQIISVKKFMQKFKKMQQQIRFANDSGQIIDEKKFSYTIDLFLFDGYMSKIQYFSLDDPNRTDVYVQTLFFVQLKNSMQNDENNFDKNIMPLYVIFDQTNIAIFYYHSSLQKLQEMFKTHVQQRKKQVSQRKGPVFRRKQNIKSITKDSNKIKLMFQQIKLKIQDQIAFQSQKSDFFSQDQLLDKILNDKLKSNVPQDFNQNQQENIMFTKVSYPQSNQQKTQFLMNALKNMVEIELKTYQLKSEITLMDVFFGYLSSQMFVFEMFWNRKIQLFSKSSTTYLETFDQMLQNIKKDDPNFYNEIKNVIDSKQENQYTDYPLKVDFNENSLIVSRKFLANKNDPVEVKQVVIQDGDMDIEQGHNKKNKAPQRSTFVVTKNQLLKNYIFIKEFSFKQTNLSDKKGDKQRVHCFLLIGEDDRKLELDPRQDPLELIVSILVDTWEYQQIYDHFRNLLLCEIENCEFKLQKKMALYYQSTRKISQLFSFTQVPQLLSTLNYKKPKPKGNKYLSTYQTQYCNDQDDKETLLEHLSNQNIVFSDGQIIFCKY